MVLILLWVGREPGTQGWSRFVSSYVDDSAPAVAILFLALLTPIFLVKKKIPESSCENGGVSTFYFRISRESISYRFTLQTFAYRKIFMNFAILE